MFDEFKDDLVFGDEKRAQVFDFEPTFIKMVEKPSKEKFVKYENAKKMAEDIGYVGKGCRICSVVAGSFIFGDFLEAYVVENNLLVEELTISTLSLAQDNIDSLYNLLVGGYVEKINLLFSDYFYSHEKHSLVPYLMERLDVEGVDLHVGITRVHSKINLLRLGNGDKLVMVGSANMRSSDNIEVLEIEGNAELYDFHYFWHESIIEKYRIQQKSLRGKKQWSLIAAAKKGGM